MEYTYSHENISSKIFEFTYMCAMRDAVLREAFKGEKTWVESVATAKETLRKYIDKVLNNEFDSQCNHDRQDNCNLRKSSTANNTHTD